MRLVSLLVILLVYSSACCQMAWFKHLPGFQARTSLIKEDTILTIGMDAVYKSFGYKYNEFVMSNTLKGDSINNFTINLDTIEHDTTRSSLISYNYNAALKNKEGLQLFVRLSEGLKKDRSFLLSFDNFLTNKFILEEFKVDTFTTLINDVIYSPLGNIYFIKYYYFESNTESISNTIIYKNRNGVRIKIKEYYAYSTEKHVTSIHLKDNNSDNLFFFNLKKIQGTEQWEEFIIKMDTLGNELWRSQPNNRDSINPGGMQFVQKPNGNLLVSWCDEKYRPYRALPPNDGSHLSQPNKYCTVWFAEIDSNGKILWRKNIRKFLNYKLQRNHDHNLDHEKAIPVKDGVIWVGRSAWIYWHNYILKTDYDGNPLWYREYELYPTNTAKSEFLPYDITATKDGGFVVTGEYRSANGNIFPNGCQLATIIKVDSFGCLLPGCQKADSIPISIKPTKYLQYCKVFPNPANEVVTIQLPLNKRGIYLLEVYSITGKLIEKIAIHESTELNTTKYPVGFYIFKLYNEQSYETHKISISR